MGTTTTAWTDLGNGVRVRQSRAFRMNSLVLLDPRHTVIVDPGVLPSELDDIAATVADRRPAEVTLLFSHAHWDHVLGRAWWPKAATIAHARLAAELQRDEAKIRGEAEALAAARGEAYPRAFVAFEPERAVEGERTLELGPWRLILRDAPGHCASQITAHLPELRLLFAAARGEAYPRAFVAFEPERAVEGERTLELGPWRLILRDAPGHCASQITAHLPELRLLFAADMLSDIEIPALDEPCEAYRRTLTGLFTLFEAGAVETLIPGHGAPARSKSECTARLLADTLYLVDLEIRVRAARTHGLSLEETQRALDAMDYVGRGGEFPMEPVHRENVRLAYAGLSAQDR